MNQGTDGVKGAKGTEGKIPDFSSPFCSTSLIIKGIGKGFNTKL
jgi:hypothetical protein